MMTMDFPVTALESVPPLFPSSSFRQQAPCNIINRNHIHKSFFVHDVGAAVNGQPIQRQKPNWKSQSNDLNTLRRAELFTNPNANTNNYASALQACTHLTQVKQLHAHIFRSGLDPDASLRTKLVSMYAMCGSIDNARLVFDKIYERDVFSWNVMIREYSRNGPYEEAVTLYYQMQEAGIQPNNFTFPFVLKACASLSALQEGRKIHNDIIACGLESGVYVGAALIDMYGKCRNVEDARQVFDKMCEKNVVLWTAMIAGYAQNGHPNEALTLFTQMRQAGMKPDSVTMVSVLLAYAHLAALHRGKMIHGYIIKSGFESHVFVATGLIDMYGKCRRIDIARQLFDKMSERSVVSWNAMIAGCAQNGHVNDVLMLFNQMQLADVKPDSVTMLCVLSECTHITALQYGEQIHGHIIRSGFDSDVFVANSLIDMYAKCGRIDNARQVFEKMSKRDVVSWNAMIAGYGMHGHVEDALKFFSLMQQTGTKPNHITFVSVLSACSHAGLVDEGWQYFERMSRDYCITPKVEHYACMVDLLGRAGHLVEAQDFIGKMPLEPGASVWGALFDACRNQGNIEIGECVAKHLFDIEPENAGCYILLSNIYAASGKWDDLAKLRAMKKDGVQKDSRVMLD